MNKHVVKKVSLLLVTFTIFALVFAGYAAAEDQDLTSKEELGRLLYFDTNLSTPPGQACASCHDPEFGFDDPDSDLPVSQGVLPRNRFGNRNSPISAYAMYSPVRFIDDEGLYVGGQFWDSRATGFVLGDPLADQALGPFLNPLEMNNPSKLIVVEKVTLSEYADLFEEVWGEGSLKDVESAYDAIALSIAAFERTQLFAQFNSKYDAYLKTCLEFAGGGQMDNCAQGIGVEAQTAAELVFTAEEWAGLQLFMGDKAKCSACHVADWIPVAAGDNVIVPDWAPEGYAPPVFTDFTYDNLGVPKNPENPFYKLPAAFNPDGYDFVDWGLGAVVDSSAELGKMKVMTLRNIGLSAPYMHNGFFTDLSGVVHFYNTRDVPMEMWPAPEVPLNVNSEELGDLGLSMAEEEALVAFMLTLSDGYMP